MRLDENVTPMGEKGNECRVFVGKPEGKRPLGSPKSGCEDIKVGHRDIGWGGMDWIHLAQDSDQ
jgi:hypothetical protein